MGKYAHFEKEIHNDLVAIYSRHGEVAREIHQDVLQKLTGDPNVSVDLVQKSPLSASPDDTSVLEKLSEYDVVSVSSAVGLGSIINGSSLSNKGNVDAYRGYFAENDLPIYVVAAGNNGESKVSQQPRVADFLRTSLVVGEANYKDGSPYIEDHSGRINPTLASDNPFNRDVKYQYYNTSPSLEGEEELIRDWLVEKELAKRFVDVEGVDGLSEIEKVEAFGEIEKKVGEEGYAQSDAVNDQIAHFMAKPEELHALVMSEIRSTKDVDENGYTSQIDGTSFSSPEQAAYLSYAHYQQEQREKNNLPILSKEELTTLAKLATVDTNIREGQSGLMYSYNNKSGFEFTGAGGAGVFHPEMFQALLDKAYEKIGSDPDIDRDQIDIKMSSKIDVAGHDPKVSFTYDSPDAKGVVIDRTQIYFDVTVNGGVPSALIMNQPNSDKFAVRLQTALESSDGKTNLAAWARRESGLGETVSHGAKWDVKLLNGHGAVVNSAEVIIHGYNEGGFMDQMMDYSKEIAPDYTNKVGVDNTNQPTPDEHMLVIEAATQSISPQP